MVTNSIVCYTSALLLMFQSIYGVELTFDLPNSARDCFHEEIEKNTSVVLEYQVVTGGQYDVDVVLEGPGPEILYQQTRSQFDSYQFTTTTKGIYTVCFSNDFLTFSHKIIYMDFQVGDEIPSTPDRDEHATTALVQLESSAQEIHESMNAILDYQTHHRLRGAQDRKHAEELNDLVLWWLIAEAFAVLAISITQVLVLRNFFTDQISVSNKMKLYTLNNGPPSLAVRMLLKALDLPYEDVPVDYNHGEHLGDDYAQLNPQKEVPVLDDDGFLLGESVAIMQYLCDQYAPDNQIYPRVAKQRALVNHRMIFNVSCYYNYISSYALVPIFSDYPRSDGGKMKVDIALNVLETYLSKTNTKYVAGDELTIADIALAASTLSLEATEIKFDSYPLVTSWYETFKSENPKIWEIGQAGVDAVNEIYKKAPDVSEMNHPLHPMRQD